ncbi:hypothetical protein LCGC14_2490830, partial [marine sediment metagenome]
ELEVVGIGADVAGRAKHFYSIYSKMTKKGREFNEIYDLTAMRVIVDSVKDCYGAIGVVHSLWKPLPGRFKDYVAMPRFNLYQALHTTVIGPEGRPLEIQIRTRQMHYMAEFGIAAHWIYKGDAAQGRKDGRTSGLSKGERAGVLERAQDGVGPAKPAWLEHLLDWQEELQDPREFMKTLKIDLFEVEVFDKDESKREYLPIKDALAAVAVNSDFQHYVKGSQTGGSGGGAYAVGAGRIKKRSDLQTKKEKADFVHEHGVDAYKQLED